MDVMVGGANAWRVRRAGDIVCSYQWVNGEPAMILFPALPSLGAGAYIIALSAAYKYADSETGDPTPYLIHQCDAAAQHMGLFPTTMTLRKIADIIVDGIPDLLAMPNEPEQFAKARDPKGEMSLKLGGKTVAEFVN